MAEIVIKLVDGELAGKTGQEIAKEFNAAALAVKKAKVGTQEFLDATQRLERASELQANYKKQLQSTSSASDALKKSFGGVLNQIPGFSAINGALQSARGGVGGLTSGFGLLRGAIIATGIGALIIAVTALIGWFSKTEKGANMISGAFKAMGAIIDTLMDRLWNIGDTLKQLFSDPISFFKNLGNDIATAAQEGYDLVQVFDDIEDRQRDLEVRSKEQEIQVDKLLLNAKNAGKTYQEKLAILEQADEITRSSYKEQLALSKEYLDAVEREVAMAEKSGTMGDDLADKRKEAKLAYLSLVQEEVTTEEKIANRREQILGKIDAANDKAAEKRAKQNEKDAKELQDSLDKLEDMRVKAIADEEAQEIAEAQLKFKRELEDINLTGAQKLEAERLVAEALGQEIEAIRAKYAQKKAEAEKKENAEQLQREKEQLEELKKALEEKQEFEEKITNEKLALQTSAAHAGLDLLASQTKSEKEARRIKKLGAIADVGIHLQQELAANAAAAAANPANAVTLGAAGAAQLAGANLRSILRAAVSTAKILLFKRGGWLGAMRGIFGGLLKGPSHENGGIPGYNKSTGQALEMEGGEFVFSGRATRALGAKNLMRINDHYTRKMASGGPINPFQDRAPLDSGRTSVGGSYRDSVATDERLLLQFVAAMDRRIDRIKAYVVASEVDDMLKVEAAIKDEADV